MDGTNFASGHTADGLDPVPGGRRPGQRVRGETWGCDAGCTGTPYGYGVEKYAPGSISAFPSCTATNAQTTCARCHQAAVGDRPATAPAGRVQPAERHRHRSNGQLVVRGRHVRAARAEVRLHVHVHVGRPAGPAWELQWGSRQPASPASDGFGYPRALTFGDGMVWVGDNNNAVITFKPDGTFVHRYGSQGPQPGMFKGGVQGIHVENGRVYATDVAGCRLQVFDEAKLLSASSIATAPAGRCSRTWAGCGSGCQSDDSSARRRSVPGRETRCTLPRPATVASACGNLSTNSATTVKPSCGGKGTGPALGQSPGDPSKTWLYIGDVKNARGGSLEPIPPTSARSWSRVTTCRRSTKDAGFELHRVRLQCLMYVSDNARHNLRIPAQPASGIGRPAAAGRFGLPSGGSPTVLEDCVEVGHAVGIVTGRCQDCPAASHQVPDTRLHVTAEARQQRGDAGAQPAPGARTTVRESDGRLGGRSGGDSRSLPRTICSQTRLPESASTPAAGSAPQGAARFGRKLTATTSATRHARARATSCSQSKPGRPWPSSMSFSQASFAPPDSPRARRAAAAGPRWSSVEAHLAVRDTRARARTTRPCRCGSSCAPRRG